MRGRKETKEEKIKNLRLWRLKDGLDEQLMIAYCVALDVITNEEARRCYRMEGPELTQFLKEKRDAKIKELGI